MRTVWAFWWIIGTAMGSPVAWAERWARLLQLHSDPAILFRAGGAATHQGVLMWTGAHLCWLPLLFSSPKLLPAPTEPLLCAAGTQDTQHIDYFLALIYGTHVKTECFWWCSHYCSTEIPKGHHKALQHYCKCWQTLMNRLRYRPLLGQKLKPHCWLFLVN